jgi:hypothetical protein
MQCTCPYTCLFSLASCITNTLYLQKTTFTDFWLRRNLPCGWDWAPFPHFRTPVTTGLKFVLIRFCVASKAFSSKPRPPLEDKNMKWQRVSRRWHCLLSSQSGEPIRSHSSLVTRRSEGCSGHCPKGKSTALLISETKNKRNYQV